MNKVYTLAVVAAVASSCAGPTTAQKAEIEWPDDSALVQVAPPMEAGAALAAAAAIREMVRQTLAEDPGLFRGCSSPEQGLDVNISKDPKTGLYYVVLDDRFDRCDGPRWRFLDGWFGYAVTSQGEVLAKTLPPPLTVVVVPRRPSPASPEQMSPPGAPPPSPPAETPASPPAASPPGSPPAGAHVQSPPPSETPPPAPPSPAAPEPTPPAPAPLAKLDVQDIHYDGWTLSGRVLISPVAGSLRLDKRLLPNDSVQIWDVSNCDPNQLVSFITTSDGVGPMSPPGYLLILHPGSWYGRTVRFKVFDKDRTGIGPECIEAELTVWSFDGKRVASQRIRAVRTLAQTPDGGVPEGPRPTPDAGSP